MADSKHSTKEKIVHINLDRQIAGRTLVRFENSEVVVWSSAHRSMLAILNEALMSKELKPFNLSPSDVIIKGADLDLGLIELSREDQASQVRRASV